MEKIIALIINLDRSKDRLDKITKRLNQLHIRWQRVSAIDGWDKKQEIYQYIDEDLFKKKHGKPVLPGEIGCYLSHLKAIEIFNKSNYTFALILEDDVELGDDLHTILDELPNHHNEWDMVKLSGIHNGNALKIKKIKVKDYFLAVNTTSYTGASCYLINKNAASWMLDALLPMTLPYDLAYDNGWKSKLKIRIIKPAPCEHSFAMGSELHPKNIIRNNFHWSKRLYTYLYRIKSDIQRLGYALTEYLKYRKI